MIVGYEGQILNLSTGEQIAQLEGIGYQIPPLAVSSDGKKVVGTSNGTLFLSDVSTGKVLHSVTDRPSLVSGAISPDGQIFAGGYENGVIKLWTLPTVQLLHTFVGYQSSVYALIFSADGHHIVSMGSDHKSDRGGYVRVSDPAATIKWWELDGLA